MPTSYGGYSSTSRGPVLFAVIVVIAAVNFVIYSWGDFKVSKMLKVYPDKPRTMQRSDVTYNAHLKSQLAKARQEIAELKTQAVPEDRETKEQERERWEEQKEHLLTRINELEEQEGRLFARIAELEEKILLVINANGAHTSNDSDFIGRLAAGGES